MKIKYFSYQMNYNLLESYTAQFPKKKMSQAFYSWFTMFAKPLRNKKPQIYGRRRKL